MHRYLTGSAIICAILALSGCHWNRPTKIEYVTPDVPKVLREPVAVPNRNADTLADVGLILTDHVEALGKANGRIVATDCILTAAERGETPDCL